MSVEFAARIFEDWNAGSRAIEVERVHPDFELTSPTTSVSGEPYRGIAGLEKWIEELDSLWEVWHLLPDEYRDLGDTVLILGSVRLQGAGSGVEMVQPMGWVLDFEGDLLLRMRIYLDQDEAVRIAEG